MVVPLTNWNVQLFALVKPEAFTALFKKLDWVMYWAPNGINVLVLLSSTPNPTAVGAAVFPLAADGKILKADTRPATFIHSQNLFIAETPFSIEFACENAIG